MPTPIEQLEAANEQIRTLETAATQSAATIEQLNTDLAAANERATAAEQRASDLETRLTAQAGELATMTERATAAEGRLALDPAQTHISGRQEPVAGGASASSGGFLEQYEKITDRKERRAFYEAHREQILAEQRQHKEQDT
jgi:hypothetical protein